MQVKIYQSNGTTLYRTENLTANQANANAGVSGNHGFAATFTNIPVGTYKVMLYAKDYNGDGDTQIGTTQTVTVTGTQPSGRIDDCTGGVGQFTITGWAYDPDATTESIGLQVKIYQSNGTTLYKTENLTADRPRNDVNNTYNITGQHGYSVTIPIADGGTYKVKVYAIDTNGDGNPQIGATQTITVTPGVTLTSETGEVTLQNGETLTGTGGANTHVTIAAGATVTLSGVTITSILSNNNHQWAGITCAGNATIILADGTTNSVKGGYLNYPGIQAGSSGTTLTIRGSGTLTATGQLYAAGIGGGSEISCGNIVIDGGTVTAKGGTYAAGIGSSTNGSICNSVTISGGNVTAKGGGGAAGIGSGNGDSRCGTITISGGTVNATGGENGAGIGNGSNTSYNVSNSCSVVISGGTVTATGGEKAAGIGSGYGQYSIFGTATISGGNVTATGGVQGAGIGCGCGSSSSNSQTQCHSITINGGTVTATGGNYAAGIGSSYYSNCGPVTITNEAVKVTAIKGSSAPTSIGKGQNGTCGEVIIGGTSYSNGITESPYICPVLTFADGTAYPNTDDYFVARAIYTKTLDTNRVGKHQAWLVPFDYTLTAEDLQKFNFYKINMIANSPDPSVETTDEMWVFLTKLNEGAVLHANMPYAYKPKVAVTDYQFTSTNTTLKAKNTGVIAKSETLEDIYSFYATYDNVTATDADPFYYVNINGGISYGTSITVGPLRWIIRKTSKFGSTPSYAREMHFFDGEDEEGTGISLTPAPSRGLGGLYTLDGRRLTPFRGPGGFSPLTSHLKKGVYIVGGRKVVIK